MSLEGARQGELAEPVTHHVLRDVDRDELLAVVHGQGMANELWQDGGAPRPRLQDLLLTGAVQLLDATFEPRLHVRSLLGRASHLVLYFVRRVMMYRSEGRAPRRVLYPLVGRPHGVIGWLPLPLPSPPPIGWSTGFMTVPRTVGRKPFQRTRPAFPTDTFSWSRLPTWPMVAMQSSRTWRTSPEGSLTLAWSPSLARICARVPALRQSCPPLPGWSSRLWTRVPSGMLRMGSALPGRMSACGPDITMSPGLSP